MTIRDKAEELQTEARLVWGDEHSKDERRIDALCLIVQKLAGLVAVLAPKSKEAP